MKSVDVKTFKQHLDSEQGEVLDVRKPEEYNAGHLAGAQNINYYDDDFMQRINALDKSKTYFVYCRSGGRSGRTLAMMKKSGFERVFEMAGGMLAWEKAGFPVEK